MQNNTGPKVAIGCGGALLFLAFCATAFFGFHVFVDPHGAISADEALPGLLGGGACMFVDFIIVAVGIALVMRGGQGGAQGMGGGPMGGGPMGGPMGSAPGSTSMPSGGTQVMNSGSLPGAPLGSAPGALPMAPGMGGAPMNAGGGQTPWHLITGCGTLFFVVSMCLSLGGIGYFYSEVERWERNLADDESHAYDPYGSYGGGGGIDDLLVSIDRGAIEDNETYTGMSTCCCFGSFLLACAFAGGTFRLMQRRRNT